MSFLRYPSIDNHYRTKEIEMWKRYHPNLTKEMFVAREKLDGSSLALWFLPDGRIKVASRNNFIGYLGDDVRFQGVSITELFESNSAYKALIKDVQTWAYINDKPNIIFGELYGGGIQNRVNYGKERHFRAFDIMKGGYMLSQYDFDYIFATIPGIYADDKLSLVCPFVAKFENLEEALAFDVSKFTSILTPVDHPEGKLNLAEGIVIKPYDTCYQSPEGSVFYLKMKNEKFKDNEVKAPKLAPDAGLIELQTAFRGYLTENRMLDVFSKYGVIEKPSQIGEYIRYIMEDAKVDFLKEFPYSGDKNADKVVFNGGPIILEMLKGKM